MENISSKIIREKIIEHLNNYFYEKKYIYASWLGGSDANNETDIYSDIDLFFCVEDKNVFEVFDEIKVKLLELGKLDFESSLNDEGWQVIKFYHLKGTPENLIIDIGILKKSEGITFEKGHSYFKPKILFDKKNIIKFKEIDKKELEKEIIKFIKIQKDFIGQKARIRAYINRKNFIEATNYYIKFIYLPLIALLRVKYTPYLYNWGRIHISRHFIPENIKKLEELMKFETVKDIEKNLVVCEDWISETINHIELNGIIL